MSPLLGPFDRRCCGAPNATACHQRGLCWMEGVHPDSPGYERKQPPSFLPLIVQVEGHALVCNGCGSLVLDNPNALSAHRDFHAR